MNCSRVNPKGHTLYKIALGLLMAVSIGACTTTPPESREPPCTRAGYFKSTDRVGGSTDVCLTQRPNGGFSILIHAQPGWSLTKNWWHV